MKSLRGFLRTKYLQRRLEQAPVVVDATVPGAEVTVSFSVHTWFEYHNRAHASYTGEPDMVEWLKNMLVPGDVFWDIGANVGAYSILAAKLCPGAQVFSFEPFIPTFAHLWENVVLNDVATQVFPICSTRRPSHWPGVTHGPVPLVITSEEPTACSSKECSPHAGMICASCLAFPHRRC